MTQQDVKFVRIRGRVVPIRSRKKEKIASGTAAGIGVAVAADAARTTRIYDKKGVTIDRKKFTYNPFAHKIGDGLYMKKNGKFVGHSRIYMSPDGAKNSAAFSWLGIKKEYRGKGYSKILSKESSKLMRSKGADYILNQVVHAGSINTNYNRARDTFWYLKGDHFYKTTKKYAMKNVRDHIKSGYKTSDIFRETDLKGVRKAGKGFRTFGNKAAIVGGLSVAALGSYNAFRGK